MQSMHFNQEHRLQHNLLVGCTCFHLQTLKNKAERDLGLQSFIGRALSKKMDLKYSNRTVSHAQCIKKLVSFQFFRILSKFFTDCHSAKADLKFLC